MSNEHDVVENLVYEFCNTVRSDVHKCVSAIGFDLNNDERHSVLGGLIARQGTLACELAKAVSAWNPHVSPLFVRAMVDVHITLAWILSDPKTRCHQYIEYGLGQAKLYLEHLKARLKKIEKDPNSDETVVNMEQWINAQKYTFLQSVNVGSWSELPIRTMAEEVGLLDLYNCIYTPYSGCTHSTWEHIAMRNLHASESALHHYTFIPDMPEFKPDPMVLYLTAQRFDDTVNLLGEKLRITGLSSNLDDWLDAKFDEIGKNGKKKEPSVINP